MFRWFSGHPGDVPAGKISDELVQLFDVAPTILEKTDVSIPDSWEAQSLWPIINEDSKGRDVVYSELARDHIQLTSEYIIMRRDKEYKLVWYTGDNFGELFDVINDPNEQRNLWNDPEYIDTRESLFTCVTRVACHESVANQYETIRKSTTTNGN